MSNYITTNGQINYLFPLFDENLLENTNKTEEEIALVKFKKSLDIFFTKHLEEICNFLESNSSGNGKSNRGRKAFDPLFMLRICLIKRRFGLTNSQMCFMLRFNCLYQYVANLVTPNFDNIPDKKTIWKYENLFSKTGLFEHLFNKFSDTITEEFKELCNSENIIIDSSFAEAPKQRNTPEENQLIKDGKGQELWNNQPHKKCHKDIDARWTKKANLPYFGYKAHAKVGEKTKFIHTLETTSANVHDSTVVVQLIRESDKGKTVFLDSGYCGSKSLEEAVETYGIIGKAISKNYRSKDLSAEQKAENTAIAKIRCRVEHVFGYIEQSMRGFIVRSVGKVRAKANIFLTGLIYNLERYHYLRSNPELINT